ncbi:pyridoxamine 5'-phosphate oxidase family protein [Geotalea uraniireducens]|uniref:Pyridoxamine 5'-phosphate oxidase-related, FMN-binding protein n=1 Tax=Geotalea uraniireducens (strain Rf4) TaxID=351605 RepID=A5GD52_GEOUR|nr:pyridoxamine 5'-phosphate oxidase family protein [Geotalea uraniireducens]ABQ24491.1 pyridoxamine 5'-phosphate oxidase-related, FMN-binding protein [Geotalea uraniireducens Rf4]
MNQQQILELINRNSAFFLATVEDGEPRVRGMLLYRAEENGIIFHTGAMKDVHRQMIANPAVELCFNDWQTQQQVRVRGTARLVEDSALKEEIVNSPGREFLKPLVEKMGLNVLSVFRVESCRAHIWTMETNFAPKDFIELQ